MKAIDGLCSNRPRTWLGIVATLAAALTAACVGVSDDEAPTVGETTYELGGANDEISFYAGTANGSVLYVENLKVCGWNQYDESVCYQQSWAPWTMGYNWRVANWWWQMGRGVRLDFYLSGYGWRSCTTSYNPWWTNRVQVDYLGSNTCKASGW